MIEWGSVAPNGVWLFGLSIIVAAWSYGSWDAARRRAPVRELLQEARYRAALWGGLMLICIGAALTSGRWWEYAAWGALAIWAAVQTWQAVGAR